MIEDITKQHRQLGLAVTEIIAEHVAQLDTRRVTPDVTPLELERLFAEPLPEQGISFDEILARFKSDVAPNAMGVPSPASEGASTIANSPIAIDKYASTAQ